MITSAEEFVVLRTSEDPNEYHRAAHESASIEIWKDVIARFPDMREWVVHNKTVPVEILEMLATDPDNRVRSAVLRKNKITPAMLDILSRDADEDIRARVARHPRTRPETVEALLCDPSHWVRSSIAARFGLMPRH
jgi:hypothetical protein